MVVRFLVVVGFFSHHLVFAQGESMLSNPTRDIINPDLLNARRYDEFKGSPYFLDDFSKGKVVLSKDGSVRTFDEIKLDLYANEIVVMQSGVASILENEFITKVILERPATNETFVQVSIGSHRKWVHVLVDGAISLTKEIAVSLVIEDKSGATGYGGNTDINQKIFKRKETFYYTTDNLYYAILPQKMSDFLSIYSDMDLEPYIKSNKLNWKKEQDVVRIFNELNRLKS